MSVTPNPYVQALEAYEITPQEPWQIHDECELHKLDWNEGAYLPSFARRVARRRLIRDEYFNWYPDCAAIALTRALAEWLQLSALNVLTFPGSDVALDTLCRTYLSPGDRVLIPTPTYENFFAFAAACGAQLDRAALPKPYAFDAAAFIDRHRASNPKIIYLVSPNNPCGYGIARGDVAAVCAAFPGSLVILDQAYVEFAPRLSCADLTAEHDNLAVTRTFSKAFSLAGMRLGYVVAGRAILRNIAKIRNGKNIGMLAQELGLQMLAERSQLEEWIAVVVDSREWLSREMSRLQVRCHPSCANFILFEVPDPGYFMAEFKRRGIYVRDKSRAVPGCLRVTVSTRRSAEHFRAALAALMSE
jgi:histidinol-phosphate aminotransferase